MHFSISCETIELRILNTTIDEPDVTPCGRADCHGTQLMKKIHFQQLSLQGVRRRITKFSRSPRWTDSRTSGKGLTIDVNSQAVTVGTTNDRWPPRAG